MSDPSYRTRISQLRKRKISKKRGVKKGNFMNLRNNHGMPLKTLFISLIVNLNSVYYLKII